MRVSEKKGRGLIFEISFKPAPYILITPAIALKAQKDFAEIFWFLNEFFRYGNVRNEELIEAFVPK
jgi:hypothetical protein